MKKIWITWPLALALLLTACCGTPVIAPPKEQTAPEASGPDHSVEQPGSGQAVKTGLAVLPSLANSAGAADGKNGTAQSDITLTAVLVDDSGVITSCVIDAIQAKIEFGADGTIVTDPAALFPTKNELGDGYGMKKASSIGREWYQQADAFAQYAVGKTVDELRGISLNEKGAPAGADLSASVTLAVGGYVDAVAQAAESARHLGAQQGDRLVLTAVTDISKSKDAAQEPGLAQTDATVAALSFRGDVISSCAIDAVQCSANFDASGQITTDLTAPILTKNQLGDDYGMKKFSAIGREWYQQADAFAQYVTGKTAGEVAGIAVNEKGSAADADLASSCSISLGDFQALVAKAAQ